MIENRIDIEHIAFSYGKSTLFEDLSTTFSDSEFCGIVGPNGSGKTTLLKCIGRMLPLSGGDLKVNGKSIREYETKELAKLISYVPQHQDNVFDVAVYDVVMMGLYPYQKQWQSANCQDDAIVREMLERCNLTHLQDRLLRELSGGEMQRTLIARAMAQQTPIMLLDEPLSNLDVAHRYEIMDILAKLNQQGVMILIILHDFSIALEYASHALLMESGRILEHAPVKNVLSPENLRKSFHLTDDFNITIEGHISKKHL